MIIDISDCSSEILIALLLNKFKGCYCEPARKKCKVQVDAVVVFVGANMVAAVAGGVPISGR